ncbi:non-specific lipid-transfer protein 8 [Cocos nucifera]|uniref:Non-specific lipid-transfer protein 8 n=1 Tax=Cocos nucifera TaxID=13894 RepID=A0A8K0I491_COCNU|nr:non-specific lipid-transfer protein 8 [Cocos nucifera]
MASSSLLSLLFLIGKPMTLCNIACVAVLGPLMPCLSSFTKPFGGKPSELCCDGARVVEAGTGTLPDEEVGCAIVLRKWWKSTQWSLLRKPTMLLQCGIVLPFPSSHDKCSTM